MDKKAGILTGIIIMVAILLICLTAIMLFKPETIIPGNKTITQNQNITSTPVVENETNKTNTTSDNFKGDFEIIGPLIYAGYKIRNAKIICEQHKYLFFEMKTSSNINDSFLSAKVFMKENILYIDAIGKMTANDCIPKASLNEGDFIACIDIEYATIGNKEVRIILDSDNIYEETNENNNFLSSFVMNVTKPDLSPVDNAEDKFKYDYASREYRVAVKTDNYGEECIETVQVAISVDNPNIFKTLTNHRCNRKDKNIYCIGSIEEGLSQGIHNITVKIDLDNLVDESNESNNIYNIGSYNVV